MCGIAGIIAANAAEDSTHRRMEKALANMAERGPDDRHILNGPGYCLGSVRLSIRYGTRGQQPIRQGHTITHINGEIYNDTVLAKDATPAITPELHVVARDLQADDRESRLAMWDGMFAAAVYTVHHRRLVLARDPFGQKPLYWAHFQDGLCYASTLPALVALLGFCPLLDEAGVLQSLMAGITPAPRTCLRNVHSLEPGTILEWSQGTIKKSSYHPVGKVGLAEPSNLRVVIRESVMRQVPDSGNFGLSLSGGIDSTLVLGALIQNGISAERIKAACVLAGPGTWDESAHAAAVARHYGLNLQIVDISCASDDVLCEALAGLQDPILDPSFIATTALAMHFRNHGVRVVIGGDGADETFAGYPTFLAATLACPPRWPLASHLRTVRTWALLHWPGARGYLGGGERLGRIVATAGEPEHIQHLGWIGPVALPLLDWLHKSRGQVDQAAAAFELGTTATRTRLQHLQAFYLRYYLPAVLAKLDAAMARQGVESRSPFLSPPLAGFGLSLPNAQKFVGLQGKRALRSLVASEGLTSTANRSKHGFGVPLSTWLATPIGQMLVKALRDDLSVNLPFLQESKVNQMIDSHGTGQVYLAKPLWSLAVLNYWYKNLAKRVVI